MAAEESRRSRPVVRLVVLVLILVGVACTAAAERNPFTGGPAPGDSSEAPAREYSRSPEAQPGAETETRRRPRVSVPRSRALFPRAVSWLEVRQRELHFRVATLLRTHAAPGAGSAGEADPSAAPGDQSIPFHRGIGIIALIAFVYGLVHAALPGHRKVLLVSYFVSRSAPVRHGVLAGIGVAVLHSGTAVVIILAAYYLVEGAVTATLDASGAVLNLITAVMVLALGIVILVTTLREALAHLRGSHAVRHSHDHSHRHHGDHAQHTGHSGDHEDRFGLIERLKHRVGLLPAIVLSAVIPCPGSAMIMLFALSLGAISLGIFAVVVFSVGMALTLSGVSVATIVLKRGTLGAFDGPLGEALHIGIETAGALVLVLFGVSLLLPHL